MMAPRVITHKDFDAGLAGHHYLSLAAKKTGSERKSPKSEGIRVILRMSTRMQARCFPGHK